MFGWLKKAVGGSGEAKRLSTPELLGYNPEFVEARVGQVRGLMTEMNRHGKIISERDDDIAVCVDAACTQIEGVLQNLKKDPEDLTRMGLALEALDPVVKLIGGCAKACALNQDKLFGETLPLVKAALNETAGRFRKLRDGSLVIDDRIKLEGLSRTVTTFFGG